MNKAPLKCPNCGNKEHTHITMAKFTSSEGGILNGEIIEGMYPVEVCVCEKCYIMFADPNKFVKGIKDV